MRERLLNTLRKNRFLTLLFISIGIVTISTLFALTKSSNKGKKEEDLLTLEDERLEDEKGEESISLDDFAKDGIYSIKNNKDREELESNQEEKTREGDDREEESEIDLKESIQVDGEGEEGKEAVNTVKSQGFIWPVEGKVITEFTTDSLIYSETLDEWRGHSGIDIKADLGSKVMAVDNGIVKKVEDDDLWGITVVIQHSQGLETRYSNLATKEMVEEGIEIRQGDHIGTVGETASIEMLMEDHLHFEILKDGKLIDPRSILD